MAAEKKRYPISDAGFNEVRISAARISSIGNFIANIGPDCICDPKQFYADMGEKLVDDADFIENLMNDVEEAYLEEAKARKEEEAKKEKDRNVWGESLDMTIKALRHHGIDAQRLFNDVLAGTVKPIEEYKGNGEKAGQEGQS